MGYGIPPPPPPPPWPRPEPIYMPQVPKEPELGKKKLTYEIIRGEYQHFPSLLQEMLDNHPEYELVPAPFTTPTNTSYFYAVFKLIETPSKTITKVKD